jgi:alpha-L-rhamnosidase
MRRMASSALLMMVFCLVWAANPAPLAAQGNLRCENATNPQGIEVAHPQLSWELLARGARGIQRAYQVLVASSEEKLAADDGDLWDSGRVISDSTSVRYQGKALSAGEHCYWKVRIWTLYYSSTFYSDPANWEMGSQPPRDRKASTPSK